MKKTTILIGLIIAIILPTQKAYAQSIQHIQIPVGTKGVIATEYKFSPEFEDVEIKKIRFLNTEPNTSVAIGSAELFEGTKRLATSTMSGDYASFENISVIIDRRAEKTLTLVVNINDRRDISGMAPSFTFADPADWNTGGDIETIGIQSGSKATNYLNTTNTIIRRLNIYDTILTLSLASDSPYGFKGTAGGDTKDLMYLNITAAANRVASNPRTVVIDTLNFTFSGDAEVRNIQLFGPANNYTSPIATTATNHLGGTTVVTLNPLGPDTNIDFGTTKSYRLQGDVTANTDNNSPSRSVRVGIENFGTSTSAGDVSWYENGLPTQNPDSQLVTWIYDPTGINRTRAPYPLNYGSQAAVGIPTQQTPISPAPQAEPTTTINFIPVDVQPPAETTTESESSTVIPSVVEESTIHFTDPVISDLSNQTNPFPDTNLSQLEGLAAFELHRRDVISGFPDGSFGGTENVNRAQAAKILLNTLLGTIADQPNSNRFSDVQEGEWYVRYVVEAANRSIISGYPDGLFRPGRTVNTAEFLKMLSLTFGLQLNLAHSYRDVDTADWFDQYAGIAETYQLFPQRNFFLLPARELTRNEVVTAIYQYLKNR